MTNMRYALQYRFENYYIQLICDKWMNKGYVHCETQNTKSKGSGKKMPFTIRAFGDPPPQSGGTFNYKTLFQKIYLTPFNLILYLKRRRKIARGNIENDVTTAIFH